MNGWNAIPVTAQYPLPVVISGIVTNQIISKPGYRITAGGALYHVVKISTSSTTVVGSIVATLQTSIGGVNWVSSKSVTITGNGDFYIKLNNEVAGDQTYLPLLNLARIVLTTTNAGDTTTITEIDELQER